jgi:hypothetical protein
MLLFPRLRTTNRCASNFLIALALCTFCSSSAFGGEEDLARFQSELSTAILGKQGPVPEGNRGMHLGIAIVPPGEAWSPTAVEDEAERTPWGTSPLALQYNYAATVTGGVGKLGRGQRLDRTWQLVVSGSVPKNSQPTDVLDPDLFRKPDRVDEARGLNEVRQPSERYLRYQEFQAAWRILETTKREDDAWRLHPRFSGYLTLDAAKSDLAADWVRFGHKAEIESAIARFEKKQLPGSWRTWLAANTAYRTNTVEVIPGVPSSRTWLFPAQDDWQNMRTWSNATFTSSDGSKIGCQIARIRINRPWMDLSLITDPEFRLSKLSGLGSLSDGVVPTNEKFSNGSMANVVEELILVRRVQGAKAGHPLSRFEYPEAINLIGYVVRSLPKVVAED